MKRVFMLVSGILALLATTAAPAGAGAGHHESASTFCVADSQFSSLGKLASSSTAKVGTATRRRV